MEKIITIQYNLKTYNPTNVQRIISRVDNALLSNKNFKLLSQKGNTLVYGK